MPAQLTQTAYLQARADQPLSVLLGRRIALLVAIVCAAYVCHVLLAVLVSRHLFGDGAWFVLKLLSEEHVSYWFTDVFRDFYVGRTGAFLYHQYPTLLFLKTGATDLGFLSTIYGLTLFSFKPIGLWLSYFYADDKRAVLFPLITLFAGTINAEGYIVSETHLFTALFWAAAFMLLTSRQFRRKDFVLLALVSAPLILCYEAMALYGLILCALCVHRLRLRPEPAERIACYLLIVWYGLGILFAALSIVNPRDAVNRSGFLKSMLFFVNSDDIGARVSVAVIVILLLVLTFRLKARFLAIFAILAGGLSMALVLYALVSPAKLSLNNHVVARTFNVIVPLALAPTFLLWRTGRLSVDDAQFKAAFLIVSLLGGAQIAHNAALSLYWNNMVRLLRHELTMRTGVIPLEETVLAKWTDGTAPVRNMHADWPLLPMSVIFAPHGRVSALVDPGNGIFKPFNLYESTALPNLKRYGIDYQPYLQALSSHGTYHFGQTVHFNTGGSSHQYTAAGWSASEVWGTWTEEREATLRFNPAEAPAADIQLTVLAGAFVNERAPELRVSVLVNDVPTGEWVFGYDRAAYPYRPYSVVIKREVFASQQPCTVTFRMSRTVSPHDLGQGGDARKLGLALVWLRLQPMSGGPPAAQ